MAFTSHLVSLAMLLGSCGASVEQASKTREVEMSSKTSNANFEHHGRSKLIRRHLVESDESLPRGAADSDVDVVMDSIAPSADASDVPRIQTPQQRINDLISQLEKRLLEAGPDGKQALEYTAEMCVPEIQKIDELAQDPRNKVICEIGFNVGHTSIHWLVHSQAHVYSFDLDTRGRIEKVGAKFVQEKFPGRFNITWGNSLQTVPEFSQKNPGLKCNILFVDGGHEFDVVNGDLANFATLADPDYHVLMADDVACHDDRWCLTPTKVWDSWVSSGRIRETLRRAEDSCGQYGQSRGWTLGHYVQ